MQSFQVLSEITAFADMIERSGANLSPLSDMADTYDVLSLLRE